MAHTADFPDRPGPADSTEAGKDSAALTARRTTMAGS